jgi:hypothetical protein
MKNDSPTLLNLKIILTHGLFSLFLLYQGGLATK